MIVGGIDMVKFNVRYLIKRKKNIDIVVIISSDGGYADIVNEARKFKKKVVVIGEEKTPNVLRESCSSFVEL